MRTLIKKWFGRLLGKSGSPVIAVFLSGESERSLAMARQVRELLPNYPHVIVGGPDTNAAPLAYADEILRLDPRRPVACWLELRRKLGRRWIALAPFLWDGGSPLRWMPWLLAPHKLLAFNRDLERHSLRLTCPIASWRFLRGERVGDIFRPTAFHFLKKIPALVGFPLLVACWALVRLRVKKRAGEPAAGPDRVLIGDEAYRGQLEAALEEPGAWLAYVGRKVSLDQGVPVESAAKIGESGAWALFGPAAALMYRRDVHRELGGGDQLEQLSLLGWQRGYRTVFAGAADAPDAATVAPERLVFGSVGDFRVAARILWSWAPSWRRWRGAIAALDTKPVALPPRRRRHDFLSLLEPGVHHFRGRSTRCGRRVAVVTPYLPFPLAHGGAIRIFNLLRTAASEFDIDLMAFAETENGREVEPLLDFCSRVVLVETPRWEPARLVRMLPRGVGKFQSAAMRAAIAAVARDNAVPIVQIEYTQLAHLRDAVDTVPAKTVLVEHDVTFDLHRQLKERAQGPARSTAAWMEELRWRRYELGHARRCDRVIAMSADDSDRLQRAGLAAERIAVVENGVDLARFQPAPEPETAGAEVLFIGSFRHFPNVMAFRFLHDEIWPAVRRWRPDARLTVVAGGDHRYYWQLHAGSDLPHLAPGVELLDFVEDVRPLYHRANIVVVPLVVSAGTNIKVLEALAMRRAVVSTEVGVAGLGLTSADNVILADAADAFAAAILGLISNDAVRRDIAARGRAFVEARYGWDALAAKQIAVWEQLLVG